MLTCFSIGLLTCIGLRFYLLKQNRDRDRAARNVEVEVIDGQALLNHLDKTDQEIPEFRYVY